MKITQEQKQAIYAKTDGHCHICRKKVALKNYGVLGARGAWEIEHSKAQANGGTHHSNNLYPACISCNRSKGISPTRTARGKHGFKNAPLSKAKRTKNTWFGGAVGAVIGRAVFASAGPLGVVVGGAVGAWVGKAFEPE
tara:strand:+ start:53 stop:469 length:417 start_codon:yes stop_codon:yes gene_type:complete